MVHLFVSISRFTLIIMFAIYTYDCFAALKRKTSEKRQNRIYHRQNGILYLMLLNANAVLFAVTMDFRILVLLGAEMVFFAVTLAIYRHFYRNASRSLVNNMCMLLAIGFIILTRLNFEQAVRQFIIAAAAVVITCFIPVLVAKLKVFNKLAWLYALVGLAGLAVVAVAGSTDYGAKLKLNLGPVSIQPSEFIKIIFVFFCGAMLGKSTGVYRCGKDDDHRSASCADSCDLPGSGRRAHFSDYLPRHSLCGHKAARLSCARGWGAERWLRWRLTSCFPMCGPA